MNYHLGTSLSEQDRLLEQRKYYGDTQDIKFSASDRVCELGCGPLSNFWIPQQLLAGTYVGVDLAVDQIQAGQVRVDALGLSNVELKIADAANTGLPNESFDCTFVRCLLIHLPRPDEVVREILRITRQGGRAIIIEPHDPSYFTFPEKNNLMEAHRARVELAYGNGLGTPDVALCLHSLLTNVHARNIQVRQHSISVTGQNEIRCRWFLSNLVRMIDLSFRMQYKKAGFQSRCGCLRSERHKM